MSARTVGRAVAAVVAVLAGLVAAVALGVILARVDPATAPSWPVPGLLAAVSVAGSALVAAPGRTGPDPDEPARSPITPGDWHELHQDFRRETDAGRSVLVLDRETGGTVRVPVRLTWDVMPGECGHLFTRLLGRPGSVSVYCPTCGVAGPSDRTSAVARRWFQRDFPPAELGGGS